MAVEDTNKYLKAFDPSKPLQPSTFNYEAFLSDVGKAAEKTRQVVLPDPAKEQAFKSWAATGRGKFPGGVGSTEYQQWQAISGDWEKQKDLLQRQAEKAATALEMKAGGTAAGMQKLEEMQQKALTSQQTATDLWTGAAKKAGEYVEATKLRTKQTLAQLDDLFKQIGTNRDFAKAHAMQVSVQSVIGSMDTELRATAEKYGVESKEYQEKLGRKRIALGNIQSQIHTGYQQIAEEQAKNFMNARVETATKMNMYTGFQEQQHVETLMGMAGASQAYELQASEFVVQTEMLKMAGLDDMANWLIQTPEFSLDLSSLVAGHSLAWNKGLGAVPFGRGGGLFDTLTSSAVSGAGAGAGAAIGSAVAGPIGGFLGGIFGGGGEKKIEEIV